MADDVETAAAEPAAQAEPVKMQILGQFTRDMSFENILAQKGLKPRAARIFPFRSLWTRKSARSSTSSKWPPR